MEVINFVGEQFYNIYLFFMSKDWLSTLLVILVFNFIISIVRSIYGSDDK